MSRGIADPRNAELLARLRARERLPGARARRRHRAARQRAPGEVPAVRHYVEQVRDTGALLGRLADGSLPPQSMAELEAAFRDFHCAP